MSKAFSYQDLGRGHYMPTGGMIRQKYPGAVGLKIFYILVTNVFIYNIYIYIYILYIYIIYIHKCTSKCHSLTTPSSEWRQPGPGNVFRTLYGI